MSTDDSNDLMPPTGPSSSDPSAAGPASVASIEALVALRQARGISSGEVASRLRLAPRQIASLERGEWQVLPGGAFIRGALRSYGRVLQVDVGPLLDAIEPQIPGATVFQPGKDLRQPMPRHGALGFGGSGSGHRVVWILLAVAAVFALAFFLGGGPTLLNRELLDRPAAGGAPEGAGQQNQEGTRPETVEQGGRAQLIAGPAPVLDGQLLAPSATSAEATPAVAAAQAVSAAASGSSVTAGASSVSGIGLVMSFSAESWIEVRDAENRVVAFGTQKAGSVREFPGPAPLSLVVGNAGTVGITWQGKAVDLMPHMRQGVARFRID